MQMTVIEIRGGEWLVQTERIRIERKDSKAFEDCLVQLVDEIDPVIRDLVVLNI